MPEAPIQEPPPAEAKTPVAPEGADPNATTDVIPSNVRTLLGNLNLDPEAAPPQPKEAPKPKDDPEGGGKDGMNGKEGKTAAAPKGEPKAGEPKPGAEPAADPGIKLRKQKIARPELPLAPQTKDQGPGTTDQVYQPDPQWEAGLDEEQKEMLADARFMEERFPDKYKGWAARTAKFLKEHADLTAKEEFDAQSPAYKAWLDKNQPRLSRKEIREIEQARVTDSVRKDYDGKLADVTHKLFVREAEPKIEAEGRTIFAELSNTALPEEIAGVIKKDGFEKANEVYALEIETAQHVLTAATLDVTELRRLATKDPETGRPLQAPVDDPAHPKFAQHQRLIEMIGYFDNEFKKEAWGPNGDGVGGDAAKAFRNGKAFVTRDEWALLKPDQRHRFWTHKLEDYIPMAKANAKRAVQMAIEQKRASMKKLGWQPPAPKVAAPPAPVKSDPPVPTNTPRIPAAVPVPGGSDPVMSDIEQRARRMTEQLNRG